MTLSETTSSAIAPIEDALPALDRMADAANQLAELQHERQQQAKELARSVGYEGALTVDALEDGIRFYQRRSVESLLECGKRLLLLKEITPHGDFQQSVERLGFNVRTARRFMQAAIKTAKTANLAVLSGQIKSASAFLELVTHDDDADIERVAALDDIERMSASQLRAALRESRAEREAQARVLDDTSQRLTALQVQLGKKIVTPTDWPDALAPLAEQVAAAGRKAAQAVSELAACRLTLFEVAQRVPDSERSLYDAALGHVAEVYERALEMAERDVGRERRLFNQSLGHWTGDEDADDVSGDLHAPAFEGVANA